MKSLDLDKALGPVHGPLSLPEGEASAHVDENGILWIAIGDNAFAAMSPETYLALAELLDDEPADPISIEGWDVGYI